MNEQSGLATTALARLLAYCLRKTGQSIRGTALLAGMSQPYLNQLCKGTRRPKPGAECLDALADALQMNADERQMLGLLATMSQDPRWGHDHRNPGPKPLEPRMVRQSGSGYQAANVSLADLVAAMEEAENRQTQILAALCRYLEGLPEDSQ